MKESADGRGRAGGVSHRGADGSRDRCWPSDHPSRAATWSSTSAAAPPRLRSSRLRGSSTRSRFASAETKMDEAIIAYLKRKYNLLIGEQSAERVKCNIGNAHTDGEGGDDGSEGSRHGRWCTEDRHGERRLRFATRSPNRSTRSPKRVMMALERTPPELSADIVDKGIVLTGGRRAPNEPRRASARGNRASRDGFWMIPYPPSCSAPARRWTIWTYSAR